MGSKVQVQSWYDFALAQMAAESYLDRINLANPDEVGPRLKDGNNHFVDPALPSIPDPATGKGGTRMTPVQQEEFFARYEIIDVPSVFRLPRRWH